MQNNIHLNSQILDIGLERRSNELRAIIESVSLLKVYWHGRVSTLPVKDQIKLEFATFYYTLPSPDADIDVIIYI